MRIAALDDRSEQERQLANLARYLAPDVLSDWVLGQGPMGTRNCARLLEKSLWADRYDAALAPVVGRIEARSVRTAGRQVIDRHGRVNASARFAAELIPGLTRLSVLELIRLKCAYAWKVFRARFDL